MSAKFDIEKSNGVLAIHSREIFKEQFLGLEDGKYTILISPAKGYRPKRYAFYFDSVLWQILNEAGHLYEIVNPDTGEQRKPRNTTELHTCMKAIYNPVMLTVNGKSRVIAGTTTDLNDTEFISKFMEQIISDHSSPPYLIEFISYEDWKELHRVKAWGNFKKKTTNHNNEKRKTTIRQATPD